MRVTTSTLKTKKAAGEKLTMLTAYDYSMAKIIDAAGVDMILVGDSLGNVVLGYDTTLPVTMEDMIHHGRAVSRAAQNAMVVLDMPFLSYHVSREEAIFNAGRLMKEAGAHCVKLEGGSERADTVRAVVEAQIPVMGHIGLTPQSVNQLGGFKIQGKDVDTAQKLLQSAKDIEAAGACSIVLECVPAALARLVTRELSIPTIGIGAGADCDGQVLVSNDMLGFFPGKVAKFVKQYIQLAPQIDQAVKQYKSEVEAGLFPGAEHIFAIDDAVLEKLY
jgi:3-methyl-2-oxobutanoate hydroxymethyltransferase